mgnify:CR=1 FL=1
MDRGNYYKLRTRDWFRAKGYAVELVERLRRVQTKDKDGRPRVIFVKQDCFGADGIAMNEHGIVFWNAVLGKANVARAVKGLAAHPYPACVQRWVVAWELRAREPTIIEAALDEPS